LVHVSELSHGFTSSPFEAVYVGQRVRGRVIEVKSSSVAASDALVTNPRPDVAIVQFNLMMTPSVGKEPLGRTLLLVASREAGGWKIAAGQLTKPNCP
jgi:hypothetical protein